MRQKRQAVAGALALSFPRGKGSGVRRDPIERVSVHLPFAARSFPAELCSPKAPPLNAGSSGMFLRVGHGRGMLPGSPPSPPPSEEIT